MIQNVNHHFYRVQNRSQLGPTFQVVARVTSLSRTEYHQENHTSKSYNFKLFQERHATHCQFIIFNKQQIMEDVITKAKGLASRVFSNNYKLDLASENWQYSLGEFCQTCQIRLKTEDCISICNCRLFCHEDCFVRQISPYLSIKSQVRCIRCNRPIEFQMKYTIDWVCNRRPVYLLSVAGSILIMIGIFLLIQDGAYRTFFRDSIAYSLLGLLGLFLIYAIVRSSRRKTAKIQDIKVVNTNVLKKGETQKMFADGDLGSSKTHITSSSSKHIHSQVEMNAMQEIM